MVTRLKAQNKYTEQYMENSSYDADFDVLTREIVTYNPVSDALERASVVGQGNSSLVLTYSDGKLTSIAKTVGSTTYTKTLSYTVDDLTGISAWTT